jgi:iron complex outermembrane recepter protein
MSDARCTGWTRSAFLPLGTTICLTLAGQAASAATPAGGQVLEEIIVTATKRTERLQDVPIAISAVSAEDIRARGLTQYADFLNSLPGVYMQDGGPGSSVVHIRGASESGGGSIVATYFGETVTSVLTNHGGKPNLRLVDIDRVEVLRGPQGTLFGADALAGVIRTIPVAPDLENLTFDLGARGFATDHSDDFSYHLEGVANIPLIDEKLALRLVAYQDEIAGYVDNVVPAQSDIDYSFLLDLLTGQPLGTTPEGTLVSPGHSAFTRRDINSEDTWGARAALTWQATDRLRVDLSYATQDVELNSEPHTTPSVGQYEQSRSMDVYEEGGYGENLDIGSLVISYDWDAVSLTSASSWMQMDRFSNQDITFLAEVSFGVPIPWSLRDTSLGELFTQEVRLQSRGDGALQWTVGAFYLEEEADLSQFVPDYSCPTCLPTVIFGQDFAFDVPTQKFSDEEQRSVFGEASYRFLPEWTVGVGARYLEDDIKGVDPGSDGLLGGGPVDPVNRSSGTVEETNPSAYLRYEPSDAMMLYLQAGRGFRSGEVNSVLPDECQDDAAEAGIGPVTEPDTMWNYEFGVKSQLAGGRFGVNAAVYKEDWQDVQLTIGLECGFSGIVNGGDVDGEGVEVELVAQPSDAWQFNLAASYNKMEFASVKEGTGFVEGQRLPDAPEKNGSAGVQYNFDLGTEWAGFARADYTYVGDVLSYFGDEVVKQESFDIVNLRLGFSRDALALELFGRNVTDERGVLVTSDPAFGGFQNITRPREYGLEMRYAFR